MTTRSVLLLLACLAVLGCATPIPSPLPQVTMGEPSPASIAPETFEPSEADPIIVCGRIDPTACEATIELARGAVGPGGLAGTTLIVVDDVCEPTVICDRKFPFDSLVVFVTAGADTTGWYAYQVTGLEANRPTEAKPWPDQIPPHIASLVRASLP